MRTFSKSRSFESELLAVVRVTDAITLVLERRVVCADECLPAIIFTLVLVHGYVATDAWTTKIGGNQPG